VFRNLHTPVEADPLDNVQVTYEPDKHAVAEIGLGEDEHCADLRRSFDVS
jgi:hypothetical protein